jgi:hypothetical protein
MTEPKRINFQLPYLECTNGEGEPRRYYIHDTLSVARFEVFEDVHMLLAKGRDYGAVFTSQKKVHELLNQSKVADAAIENYNSMMLVKEKIEKRFHPAMRLVALFANLETEDMTKYDEVAQNKKIDDWVREGFAMNDFFTLAFSFANDILESYNETFQEYLKPPKKEKASSASEETDASSGPAS